MADKEANKYIPALSFSSLTPFYDRLIRWTMREFTFKKHLVEQARIEKGHHILDLGCGTATLTLLIKQSHPETEVFGLDGDPKILEIARAKSVQAGLKITLDHRMSFKLPYLDCSFDRVLSSLVFHHLTRENKTRTSEEVFRVLRPGGELHVADFGKPRNPLMYLVSLIMRRFEETSDNIMGLLPKIFSEAGFEKVEEYAQYITVFGSLSLYKARKPAYGAV